MKPRKPLWTPGLFVTQHHLQQQDNYHERQLAERVRLLSPLSWGVSRLEVDLGALANGDFAVISADIMFPTGTSVKIGEGGYKASRRVSEAFPANAASLAVYLAIPTERDAGPNLAEDPSRARSFRWLRRSTPILDFNTGAEELQLDYVVPNVEIILGEEPRAGFEAIQVAELVRGAGGALVCRDTFIPPCTAISASAFIMDGLRRLLGAMVSRWGTLADTRRRRVDGGIDFAPRDAVKIGLLQALGDAIPLLVHAAELGLDTPETLYRTLLRFVGAVAPFAADVDVARLPKYSHLSLRETFEPLFALTLRLAGLPIPERFIEIPLQVRDDGLALGKLEDPALGHCAFYLAAAGPMPEPELKQHLPRLTKIASWQQVGALLNSALNGARITPEAQVPADLPSRPGVTFFRLETSGDFWRDIMTTASIAVYHPLGPQQVAVRLFAIDPRNL